MTSDDVNPRSARELAEPWAREGRDAVSIELVTLLRRSALRSTDEPDRVLAAHGLTRGQFDVLAALRHAADRSAVTCSAITQAELAERMMVTPPGMKKRLDTLYERRLIARDADAMDGRRLLIRLTPAGDALLRDVLDDFFQAEGETLSRLSGAEREQLLALLRKLVGPPS